MQTIFGEEKKIKALKVCMAHFHIKFDSDAISKDKHWYKGKKKFLHLCMYTIMHLWIVRNVCFGPKAQRWDQQGHSAPKERKKEVRYSKKKSLQ